MHLRNNSYWNLPVFGLMKFPKWQNSENSKKSPIIENWVPNMFLSIFICKMVRSTLLFRLWQWALRATSQVQRKCVFQKYCRPRCIHYGNIFEKWVAPAKSKEYEASEKCIQNVFWQILTWEFLGFWAGTGAAKGHFSGKVQKLQNHLKIVCSECFACFLLVNGAQHSPLSFL